MGLHFARARRTTGDEPSASITWREYVVALSAATHPGDVSHGGHGGDRRGVTGAPPVEDGTPDVTHGRDGSAIRPLEIALRLVRRRARWAVGLEDALQLQCEAARFRLMLIQLYVRLGNRDRAGALAQESQDVL
jgi:hypothetical protein